MTISANGGVTGNSALKGPQAYPPKFGQEIQACYAAHADEVLAQANAAQVLDELPITPADLACELRGSSRWADARLNEVFECLRD